MEEELKKYNHNSSESALDKFKEELLMFRASPEIVLVSSGGAK